MEQRQIVAPGEASAGSGTEGIYDNIDRLTTIASAGQAGGNTLAQKWVTMTYNAAGLVSQLDRYAFLSATLVSRSIYTYDNMNRLKTLKHDDGSTALAGYTFTYDDASRITKIESQTDGMATYAYDHGNQLTGADYTGLTDETYTYDANGNRTMSGYATTTANRTTNDGTYTYTYDSENNLIGKAISAHATVVYTWDHRDRLTAVDFTNASGTNIKAIDYYYDYQNRLIRRDIDADGAGAGGTTKTFWAQNGDEVDLEFDAATIGDISHRYLYGPDIDEILIDEQVADTAHAGNNIYTLGDHQNTTRDLADRNEGTGVVTIVNHRVFTSFGKMISETNSAINETWGYTARLLDEDTGLQNNRNRWFVIDVGQWASEDPIGFDGGDENLRRYVHNQIVVAEDPLGLWEKVGANRWEAKEGDTFEGLATMLGKGDVAKYAIKPIKPSGGVPTIVQMEAKWKIGKPMPCGE